MDICANVIVKHKALLQDVLEFDKIHVDIFECIKKAMKNKKNCSKSYKKHFSISYKLPYSIFLASSPPSEMKSNWSIGKEIFCDFDDFENENVDNTNANISTCESETEELWWAVEMDPQS